MIRLKIRFSSLSTYQLTNILTKVIEITRDEASVLDIFPKLSEQLFPFRFI